MMISEHESTKLGHAINFVSHHIPQDGEKNYSDDDNTDVKMSHVGGTVRLKLNRALEAALDFITREFSDEKAESGTVQTPESSYLASATREGAERTKESKEET